MLLEGIYRKQGDIMGQKFVKYDEGQWFAVPLRIGGYALGIIVRGSYKTKGGLGYFFGPKFDTIPSGDETYSKSKENPIYICHFGDLGIIKSRWPLIQSGKPFYREEWPVPLFHRVLPFPEGKAIIVEYRQDYSGMEAPIRETMTEATEDVIKLPKDSMYGSGAVEIVLSKLLE